MQRPPELVPIPEYLLTTSLVPPWYLRKVRKIPIKFRQNLAEFQFGKILENLRKLWQKLIYKMQNFDEKLILENSKKYAAAK